MSSASDADELVELNEVVASQRRTIRALTDALESKGDPEVETRRLASVVAERDLAVAELQAQLVAARADAARAQERAHDAELRASAAADAIAARGCEVAALTAALRECEENLVRVVDAHSLERSDVIAAQHALIDEKNAELRAAHRVIAELRRELAAARERRQSRSSTPTDAVDTDRGRAGVRESPQPNSERAASRDRAVALAKKYLSPSVADTSGAQTSPSKSGSPAVASRHGRQRLDELRQQLAEARRERELCGGTIPRSDT